MDKIPWSLIVAVNDPAVLSGTLLRSPAIDGRCEVIEERGHTSAGTAYNAGLRRARGEVAILVHQDVFLPPDWFQNVALAIRRVERDDPDWGVLGPIGVGMQGEILGHVYSTGLGGYVGEPFMGIHEAISLDELALVVRRGSGLRFDEDLPGFHLFGTDICLTARRCGMGAYIVPAFCIHNSNGVAVMPREFWRAYLYLRRKWRDRLPLQTCCTQITRGCGPLLRRGARDIVRSALHAGHGGGRISEPERLYEKLRGAG